MGGTAHDVHSPFVFDLLNDVIRDETPFYIYDKIEALRARLLLDESILSVTDLGTGGERNQKRSLKVKYIAGTFLKSARCSQLLFRLVNHFHPKNILELGTSLGITTLYLASPYRKTRVSPWRVVRKLLIKQGNISICFKWKISGLLPEILA